MLAELLFRPRLGGFISFIHSIHWHHYDCRTTQILASTLCMLEKSRICLFNRDCLYFRQLKYAIKGGEVLFWMSSPTLSSHFMGLAKLRSIQTHCSQWLFGMFLYLFVHPSVHLQSREAWLMNWLANVPIASRRWTCSKSI